MSVGDRAVERLKVSERPHVLHCEELQTEWARRIEFPAAAVHHGERLLIIGIRPQRSLAGIFRWKRLAYLGKVSYGFYTFHYPVILATIYLVEAQR